MRRLRLGGDVARIYFPPICLRLDSVRRCNPSDGPYVIVHPSVNKNKYKVCRGGVEIGIFDALEMIDLHRSGIVKETDECFLDFDGFLEKTHILGRLMMANDMECLYRLIKSHAAVSISDLVRLSRMSEGKVRYYIGFFLWYGVATDADDAELLPDPPASTDASSSGGIVEVLKKFKTANPKQARVRLTERNVSFVEGFKCRAGGGQLSALEFFVDAYVELPVSDGFDD